jgi:hypothetical protein
MELQMSKKMKKEITMNINDLPDFFGYETEAEFLDWVVGQFQKHANVEVFDRGEISYQMELGEQDGCCELCYTEDACVEVRYAGMVLIFGGYYSYERADGMDKLVLTSSDTVEVKQI